MSVESAEERPGQSVFEVAQPVDRGRPRSRVPGPTSSSSDSLIRRGSDR